MYQILVQTLECEVVQNKHCAVWRKNDEKIRCFFTVVELVTKKLFEFKRKLIIRKTDYVL